MGNVKQSVVFMLVYFMIFSYLTLQIFAGENDYSTCGDCWCIPGNNGTAPCPLWKPKTEFPEDTIKKYESQKALSIYELHCNPYEDQSCSTSPHQSFLKIDGAVCAFKYPDASCGTYEMITYGSRLAAEFDGAVITHAGSCGLCSTAQDLAVYLTEDFTSSGKICATKGLFNETAGLSCYIDIGLTQECAKIWNFDGIFDGKACGKTCVGSVTAPNNGPPPTCPLNPCLQCDEDLAGPIFSQFSGRTRRRSGLISEIVRECDSIARIYRHDPCPFTSSERI